MFLLDPLTESIVRISTLFLMFVTYAFILINRVRLKIKETKKEKQDDQLVKNKNDQIKKEEELKKMAKFLCDKCGKETDVKDAVQYKDFSVCKQCAETLQGRAAEIDQLRQTIESYEATLDKLRKQLNEKENTL